MEQDLITRIVEAALLAAPQPLTLVQLNGLFPLDEPAPDGSIHAALEQLQADCASRGVELVEVASGWRYQVKADVHPWVARMWTERQTKYTRATLETLALIAYRQPITRGEIEQIRGVATNSNIIKALEEREWIRVVGHRDMPGKPELLGTTKGFLDYFGLKRLDELPALSELKDFGELEPQLQFEGEDAPVPVGVQMMGPDGEPASQHDDATSAHDGENTTGEDEHDDAQTEAASTQKKDEAPADDEAADTSSEPHDAADSNEHPHEADTDADTTVDADTDTETPALAADGDSTRSNQ